MFSFISKWRLKEKTENSVKPYEKKKGRDWRSEEE